MLTEREKRVKESYEKQLSMSKWKFILLYGVVLWGITVLVIMMFSDRFLFNKSFDQQWREGMLGRILIMPFAGIFFGWVMRRLTEKKLARLVEKDKTN